MSKLSQREVFYRPDVQYCASCTVAHIMIEYFDNIICRNNIKLLVHPSPQIHEALFHSAGPCHNDGAVLVVVNLMAGSMPQ